MSKFNIFLHIIDHAHFTFGTPPNRGVKLMHFNTSVDATYFLRQGISTQHEIDKIMEKILTNVLKCTMKVKEKNGIYIAKNGIKKQKYRERTIIFGNIFAAYHKRHFDSSKSVMPHFHFVIDKNARVGKDFIYLKQALEKEAKVHHIKFNFMEPRQNTGLSKSQMMRIKKLSWLMHQGDTNKIHQYLEKPEKLSQTLELMKKHYENTQNLSFFIKTLMIINQRLQELNISYQHEGVELKEDIFFFLASAQKNKLEYLANSREIELNLNHVLDREILKYAHGFKSDVMDVMVEKFKIPNIRKSQLFIASQKPKKTPLIKTNNFKARVIQDIRNALSDASNEKQWKHLLKEIGYMNVSVKSAKNNNGNREKIGLTIVTKKKTNLFIPFHEMSLMFSQITKILMNNKKKKKNPKIRKSKIEDYKVKKNNNNEIFSTYQHRIKILLQLYQDPNTPFDDSHYEHLQALAKKYHISSSKMYGIATYKNEHAEIVDSTHKIELKRVSTDGIQFAISDMLDIAIVKGWNLARLSIKGDEKFIAEAKKQISHRTRKTNIPKQGEIIENKPKW